MKQYKAILLDLDNTLYDYASAHQQAMQGLVAAVQAVQALTPADIEQAYAKARADTHSRLHGTAASHHRLLYMQHLCEQLQLNPARYALLFQDAYWNTFLSAMQLFPYVSEFLIAWRNLDKRIALVTDLTAQIQYQKLAKLALQDSFDHLVISEEVGFDKPHANMFLTALAKLQLNKDEVIMIGDDYMKDVLGARNLGIAAYWFSAEGQRGSHHEKGINFKQLLENIV